MEEGLLTKDGAPQNLYDAYCKYYSTSCTTFSFFLLIASAL